MASSFNKGKSSHVFSASASWKDIVNTPDLEEPMFRVSKLKSLVNNITLSNDDIEKTKKFVNEDILTVLSFGVIYISISGATTVFEGDSKVVAKDYWIVDYGDGSVEKMSLSDTRIPPHTYSKGGVYTISIKGAHLVRLGNAAFKNCSELVNIQLPNSITEIGDECFYGCENLIKIPLPKQLNTIGAKCFYGCSSLNNIEIPENVDSIGERCFANCVNLGALSFYSTTFYEYENTLEGNDKDKFVLYVPQEVISEYRADEEWSKWTIKHLQKIVVNLKNKFSKIFTGDTFVNTSNNWFIDWGDGNVSECSPTTNRMPEHKYENAGRYSIWIRLAELERIEDESFAKDENIISIELPEGLLSIGYGCFSSCPSLKTIVIPSTVEKVGNNCFEGCNGVNITFLGITGRNNESELSDVFGTNSILTIGNPSSYNLYNVTSENLKVLIKNTKDYVGEYCFYGCNGITDIVLQDNLVSIGKHSFDGCSKVTEIDIPSNVETIGEFAFFNCGSLKILQIPSKTNSIGTNCFRGCYSIESIKVDGLNEVYDSRDNCNGIIHTTNNEMVFGCKNTIIPSSIEKLGVDCFRDCSTISYIKIPLNITTIGNSCFEGCTALSKARISAYVTSLGDRCYVGCSNLKSIYFLSNSKYVYPTKFLDGVPTGEEGCSIFVIDYLHEQYEEDTKWNKWNIKDIPTSIASVIKIDSDALLFDGYAKTKNEDDWQVLWGDGTISPMYVASNRMPNHLFSDAGEYTIRLIGAELIELGTECFKNCTFIKEITIPETVVSIGADCFGGCNGVKIRLYGSTGRNSESLKEDLWGENADITIYNAPAYGMFNVISPNVILTIDGSVSRIGNHCFDGCQNIVILYINNGVEEIGDSAFRKCTSLKDNPITIPSSIVKVGKDVFVECSDLEVSLIGVTGRDGSSVQSDLFGENAKLTISNPVEYLLYNVTSDNMEVTIADDVEDIGNYAFYGCTKLSSLTLGNSVKAIGGHAFQKCSILDAVTFPSSVQSLDEYCFAECIALKSNTITITEHINNIGDACFYGCEELKIVLNGTSGRNSSSKDSDVFGSNAHLYVYDTTSYNLYKVISQDMTVEIKNKYAAIGDYCFYGCSGLKELNIEAGITKIGTGCFGECISLSSIIFPNTLYEIGNNSFENCSGLSFSTITIPNSVGKIGNEVFKGCYYLTIELNGSTGRSSTSDETDLFGDSAAIICGLATSYLLYKVTSTNLTVEIKEGINNIESYCFSSCPDLISVSFPNSLKKIYDNAFSNCTSLASLSLKDGIEEIGSECFKNCIGLSTNKITIPKTVTKIGDGCFYGCRGLTIKMLGTSGRTELSETSDIYGSNASIEISAKKIQEYAFYNVTSANLRISLLGVQEIAKYAFGYCTGLEELTSQKTIVTIGDFCFIGCVGLSEITIPKTCSAIGHDCFSNCNNLVIHLYGVTGRGEESLLSDLFGSNAKLYIHLEDRVDIPDYISYNVKSDNLKVYIDTGFKTIGAHSFENCLKLSEINYDEGIVSYGECAFKNCGSLEKIEFPETVTTISKEDLAEDISLKKVYLYPIKKFEYPSDFMKNVPDKTTEEGCRLYVPYEYIEEYKADEHWSNWMIYPAGDKISIEVEKNTTIFTGESEVLPYEDWTIDWGDGSKIENFTIDKTTMPSHTYSAAGKYIIRIGSASIVKLGERCFNNCSGLKSFKIPPLATILGNYCFYNCKNLSTIELSNKTTNIGNSCFANCSSLGAISIPSTTTYIGDSCFYGCSSIETIALPSSITTLKKSTFENCTKLHSVEYIGEITSIGESCFKNCHDLSAFELPENISSIPAYCFENCVSITNVTLPSSVADIGISCYKGCESLNTIKLTDKIKKIPQNCFDGCLNLEEISIPESVLSIDGNAFRGCAKIVSLSLPVNITNIGNYAFSNCIGLNSKKINIPAKVVSIGDGCFSGCSGIQFDLKGVTGRTESSSSSNLFGDTATVKIYNAADFLCYKTTSSNITFKFSSDITKLGESIFEGCTGIVRIEIPETITTLSPRGFYNCTALRYLTFENYTKYEYPEDFMTGVPDRTKADYCIIQVPYEIMSIYSADTKWNRWVIYSAPLVSAVVVQDNTTIFSGSSSVTPLNNWTIDWGDGNIQDMPSSVNAMPSHTYEKGGLYNITLSKAYLTKIGDSCFSECEGLLEISLPNSIVSLGDSAFSACTNLRVVKLNRSVSAIGVECFKDCNSLYVINIPDKVTALPNGCFNGCTSLLEFDKPFREFSSIGSYCFYGCTSLTKGCFGNADKSMGSIGDYAFYGCENMVVDSITGNILNSLGKYSFYNCINVRSVVLNNATVPDFCFYGCSSLVEPANCFSNIVSFGKQCFRKCKSIRKLTLTWSMDWQDKTTKQLLPLHDYQFAECDSLKYVLCSFSRSNYSGRVYSCPAHQQLDDTTFFGCEGITFDTTAPASGESISFWVWGNYSWGMGFSGGDIFQKNATVILRNHNAIYSSSSENLTVIIKDTLFSSESVKTGLILQGKNLINYGAPTISNCTGLKTLVLDGFTGDANVYFKNLPNLERIDVKSSRCMSSGKSGSGYYITYYTCAAPAFLQRWFSNVNIVSNLYLYYTPLTSEYTHSSSLSGKEYSYGEGYLTDTATTVLAKGITNIHIPYGESAGYTSSNPYNYFWAQCSIYALGNNSFYNLGIPMERYSCSVKLIVETKGETTIFKSNKTYLTEIYSNAHNIVVNWGDGTTNTISGKNRVVPQHMYQNAGKYEVSFYKASGGLGWDCNFYILGDDEFVGETNLKGITFIETAYGKPSSLHMMSFGSGCFSECTGLEYINIPSTTKTLGDRCFSGCMSLEKIEIPSSIQKIGHDCFSGCNGLSVELYGTTGRTSSSEYSKLFGDNAKVSIHSTIDDYEFCNVDGMVDLDISPGTVIDVPSNGFKLCHSIKKLQVSYNVKSIKKNCFSECSNIEVELYGRTGIVAEDEQNNLFGTNSKIKVHFPEEYMLYNITSPNMKVVIEDGVLLIPNYFASNASSLSSLTIAEGVKYIGMESFYGCIGLTNKTVSIPNTVFYIGEDCFESCNYVKFNLYGLTGRDYNCIAPYDSDMFGTNATVKNYVNISEQFSKITSKNLYVDILIEGDLADMFAFGCSGLASVTIPNTVSKLGYKAFAECYNLNSVDFQNGATEIGDSSFESCTSLEEITIPESVVILGERAFFNATKLVQMVLEHNGVYEYPTDFITDQKSSFTIYVPSNLVDSYRMHDGWKKFHIESIDTIGDLG